ncbi:MAG: arabinose-5-phosphate isomerase [Cognaticolwellia sp.]|jgi:arabinose-5-phosphate isomerase
MNTLNVAREVIAIEIQALKALSENLTPDFSHAVDTILSTSGRTIICGMGKSGIIGKKIAASFASTGTPSFFMHPGEAFHGDLGMVTSDDVFIAISNSGETDEVLKLLPFLRDNGNRIIGITGNPYSTLAKNSHYHLNIEVPEEACPLQLAPTSSTTATLVIGDALTVALMKARNFKPENFARFHPGGSLGRRLLGKVSDEMKIENLPVVNSNTSMKEVIHAITEGKLGVALIKNGSKIDAIITDGDLRRAIENHNEFVFNLVAKDICTTKPVSITPNARIEAAIELMEEKSINCLIVQDDTSFYGVFQKY